MSFVSFSLTLERVDRLQAAGICSLRDLGRVLAALDLKCSVQINQATEREAREWASTAPRKA